MIRAIENNEGIKLDAFDTVSAVPSLTRPVPQPLLAPLSLRTVIQHSVR